MVKRSNPSESQNMNSRRLILALLPLALLGGCVVSPRMPLQVSVVSVERPEGSGMQLRFMVRLRVQNPNDVPIQYSGAFAELQLRSKTVGTGVSDVGGQVPRLGETFVNLPVTVSALAEVRQATGLYGGENRKLDVVLKGKLASSLSNDLRFEWRGELIMPVPAGS